MLAREQSRKKKPNINLTKKRFYYIIKRLQLGSNWKTPVKNGFQIRLMSLDSSNRKSL